MSWDSLSRSINIDDAPGGPPGVPPETGGDLEISVAETEVTDR
jgi:hypothetical protein